MNPTAATFDDTVSLLYARLRAMSASFEFKPGERINESALSRQLGASRTPLREALNRLVAEGFIEFQAGRGFFCRPLSSERIKDLYQARVAVECEAVRHAGSMANVGEFEDLEQFLDECGEEYASCRDSMRLLELDEAFHLRLCALSGNAELIGMLKRIYDKIRFVRAADLRQLQSEGRTTTARHRAILKLTQSGDGPAAADAMRAHIEHRTKHATEAVRLAFADLYAPRELSS